MYSFRKLFARSGKSQSCQKQSASQMSLSGFAAPVRPPLERRRTPYPHNCGPLGSSSSAQTAPPVSSGRAGYSPSDSDGSSEDEELPHHCLPRLLNDPGLQQAIDTMGFQTEAVWARLAAEEENILRRADPEYELLARRFEEALESDPDDSDVRARRVRIQGTMSRRLALRKRLGF